MIDIQDLDNWIDLDNSEDILGGFSKSYSIKVSGKGYASSSSSIHGFSNGSHGFYSIDLKAFSKGKFKKFKKTFHF